MRSWLSDILLWEILRDVEFSTFHQPKSPKLKYKILKLMYFLSEPMRCFITDVWRGWGHFLKEGTCRPSVWAVVLSGALIHVRGNITNMYVTFLLLFQLNFVVQVWAPRGFWDRIHFLCFEEAGSLHNRVSASFLGGAAVFSWWRVNKFIDHRLAGWLWGEDRGW